MSPDELMKEPICEANHSDEQHEAMIRSAILSENESVDIASLFAHLADCTRVRILSMLAHSDMCVCEISDILGMSQPAVSHHLRILRQCGIVRFKKLGKRALYYLNDTDDCRMIRQLLIVVSGKKGHEDD